MHHNVAHNQSQVDKGLQTGGTQSDAGVNTEIVKELVSTGMLHVEGGWPASVNPKDEEQTDHYRQRVLRSEPYVESMQKLTQLMEHAVLQNNAVDIYGKYFKGEEVAVGDAKCTVTKLSVYRGPGIPSTVLDIDIYPGPSPQLAATMQSGDCYVWEEDNATAPFATVPTPSSVICLAYHPKDNRLGGGLQSGQVAIWNNLHEEPSYISRPERSHRGRVTCFRWNVTKTGKEFFTTGEDGFVKWWDCESMSKPIDEINIGKPITSLEYEPNTPAKYMVGTADGYVVCGNRKGTNQQEKLPWMIQVSGSPVYTIERNKAFPKIFLTVDRKSVLVWSEDCKKAPIFQTTEASTHVTTAKWSPSRFSLVVAGRDDGFIDIWDFLERRDTPVRSILIEQAPVGRIMFQEQGELMGKVFVVGTGTGCVHLSVMSKDLVNMDFPERAKISAVFDLEVKRETIVQAKIREMELKVKKLANISELAENEDEAVIDANEKERIAADREYWSKTYLAAVDVSLNSFK